MQNYENPAINQTRAAKSGVFSTSAGPGIFRRINKYRDDGTYADELLIFFYIVLAISAVFTLGFGWALHHQIFEPYVGNTWGHVTAFLFTAFIEACKISLGFYVLEFLLFRLFDQTKTDFALSLLSLIIFVGAFYWSYYNSTHGVQFATKIVSEWKINREVVDPSTKTAPIDGRIKETQSAANNALNIKWKGTTTRGGQKIAANATSALAEQEKQKTLLIQQSANEQARLDNSRDTFISGSSNLFSLLGGKMEFFQLFIMIGIVCCRKILNDRIAKNQNPNRQTQPNQSTVTHYPPYQGAPSNGNGQRNQIGFRYGNQNPVSQPPQTVTQPNGPRSVVGADQVFKHFLTRLQRDVPNFNNKSAKPESVAARLVEVLREASEFPALPSYPVLHDFISYTVIEVIAGMQANNQLSAIPKHIRDWIETTWNYVMTQEGTPAAT